MGKCFSCLKSTSSHSREQTVHKDHVKGDLIISSKEENTPMFANSQCVVPHLQTVTVLFQKNVSTCTLSQVINEGNVKEKQSRVFYPRISSITSKLNTEDKIALKTVSENKINSLYNKYKDPIDENYILTEGIERLCSDLNLLPEEFKVLILAWQFDARQMCQFTKSEFIKGCLTINADSIKGIQQRLVEISTEVESNKELFKSLYRYTFSFGLDNNVGQRILPVDIAICLWKLVFTVHIPPILPVWLRFLVENAHIRGIPRDTWNMFLNFSEYIGNDLSSYDDTEAWPSIFDEFVEFENDKGSQKSVAVKDISDKSINDIS